MNAEKSQVLPFRRNGAFFYKRACVQIDRSNFLDAVGFLRRALECEPYNYEYMMDLADVYARIGCYEESNQILINVIRRGESSPECFFGMGCNFFALKQFEAARDALAAYERMDPDGEFIEAVEDMLDDLDDFEDMPIPSHQIELATQGKRALDEGDYDGAVKLFEQILSQNPELLFVRNNMALAFFCRKETQRAIQEAEKVLREEPENLHALCNLSLFYSEGGKEAESREALSQALELELPDQDDLYKLCLTLLELGLDEEAASRLRSLLLMRPYDKRVLHYYAVCCYNIGDYKEALTAWDRVGRIDPDSLIAPYCMQKTRDAMHGEKREHMHYYYQLPGEEVRSRLSRFFELLGGDKDDVARRFNDEPSFRAHAKWGLGVSDPSFQHATVKLLGYIGGEYAEEMLREFLLSTEEGDEIKREVMANLKSMGAKEPYIALMEGAIVEVRLNVLESDFPLTSAQEEALDLAVEKLPARLYEEQIGHDRMMQGMTQIWLSFLREELRLTGARLRIVTQKNWAAALAVCLLDLEELPYNRSEILEIYEVSSSTLSRYVSRIGEVVRRSVVLRMREEEK